MPNYAEGKIYKLYADVENSDVYYGSTTQTLPDRITGHRCDYRAFLNGKGPYKYRFILIEKYGIHNFKIELVEKYPCENKISLSAREGEYIIANKCVNHNIPGRSEKQYRQDNKDKISTRKKEYYNRNKEDRLEYGKKWRKDHREKSLDYGKQYRQDNKDKISTQKKDYYNRKKEDKLKYYQDNKQRLSERIICECGCEINRSSIKTHEKSKKHQLIIQNKCPPVE
jgi:hypothetical protein